MGPVPPLLTILALSLLEMAWTPLRGWSGVDFSFMQTAS